MLFNYHTHTKRCGHANGEDEEYVEKAIQNGVKTLGFSDHAPYLFDIPSPSTHRMEVRAIEDYANSINALKKEYEKDIRILLGFELEYYPKTHEKEMEFLRSVNPEYIILGQHYIYEEHQGYASVGLREDIHLHDYVSQAIEGMQTGDFLYLAHPDLPGCNFSPKVMEKEYLRLCESAKALAIPLEINFLGIQGERQYPNMRFWQLAGAVGNNAVFGVDAHEPNVFLQPTEDRAREIAKACKLEIIEKDLI